MDLINAQDELTQVEYKIKKLRMIEEEYVEDEEYEKAQLMLDEQRRLRKRLNYNPKIFYKLKKLQLPLEFKKRKSDFIVKNNFKSSSIKKNVKVLKKKILRK